MKSSRAKDTLRRDAYRLGRRAEGLALWWLRLKGYRVLARGVTVGRGSGAGEVDMVVRRGRVVAFVEVKARPTLEAALDALSRSQRRRIETGAAAFMARQPALAACDLRFDLMLVVPGHWPRHLPDAWRPE